MRRSYLLVFNFALGRNRVKGWADASPLVQMWRSDLPNTLYLISEASAADLSRDLEQVLGTRGRYLVTEVSDNRQGRLPADSWYLLRHKRRRKQPGV